MNTLYNDNEPYVCQWLRNLIEAGELPDGEVSETPIQELDPHEIPATFHAFAGIGGWPLALRLAGWPDDRPVWTGSCPCQPFSSAGKGRGTEDERHLWPVFRDLVEVGRPAAVFGEQVAGRKGVAWMQRVQASLRELGYLCEWVEWPSCCFGAPFMGSRIYWLASPDSTRDADEISRALEEKTRELSEETRQRQRLWPDAWERGHVVSGHDGIRRRVEPTTPLLVDGFPERVDQIRAYGNAIVPQVAAEFLRAFMETEGATNV